MCANWFKVGKSEVLALSTFYAKTNSHSRCTAGPHMDEEAVKI